jgi:predicted dehydrogenase
MHAAARSLVDAGGLGEILEIIVDWQRLAGRPPVTESGLYPGGPIISDLGSHLYDLTEWFLGRPEPRYVIGSAARPHPEHAELMDYYGGLAVMEGGAQVFMHLSYAGPLATSERASIELVGSSGRLVIPIMIGRDDDPRLYLPAYSGTAWGVGIDNGLIGRTMLPQNPSTCFAEQAKQAVSAALGGDSGLLCTGEEGVAVARLVDAFIESGRTRRPVQFDAPGG